LHERLSLLFIPVVLLLLIPILCVSAEEGSFKLPQDTEQFFRIGFSKFIGKNLDPENEYLTFSLPLLLRESVETIGKHTFGAGEKELYRRMIVSRKITETVAKLNSMLEKRDLIFFQALGRKNTKANVESINRTIKSTRDYLNYLRSVDIGDIEFPDEKPVKIVSPGNSGKLYDEPQFSAFQLSQDNDLDLLVWGKVEQISDTLFVEIHAFERAREANVFNYTDAGTRERIYGYIKSAIDGLGDVILGADWGNLAIKTTPPDSSIYLDGNFVGRGVQLVRFVPAGEIKIRIEREGYLPKDQTVVVSKHQTSTLEVELVSKKKEEILIKSSPPGATVYVNSLWAGKTPVSVARPEKLERVLVLREGYEKWEFTISPDMIGNEIDAKLKKAILPREEIIKRERDKMYRALGWWFVSIPLPIFAYAYAIDFKVGEIEALVAGNSQAAGKMALYSDIMYYGYLGGLFINMGLLVNVIFNISDYIKSVNE